MVSENPKECIDFGIKFKAIFNETEKDEYYVKELGKIPLTKAKFIFKKQETKRFSIRHKNKLRLSIALNVILIVALKILVIHGH